MTLVKLNRINRDNFLPGLNSHFYENNLHEMMEKSLRSIFNSTGLPPVNIKENEKDFEIHLIAPGFKKQDFNLTIEKDLLSISVGENDAEKQDLGNFSRQEFYLKTFNRTFNLPENADTSNVYAEYQDGILVVKIQKKIEEKPHIQKIEIA